MRLLLLILIGCAALVIRGCSTPTQIDSVVRPTRVAVLKLGPVEGEPSSRVTLGTHVTAEDLKDAADALAAELPDVVLIHIACHSQVDSPLGIAEFIDTLETRPFGTARVVAFVRDGLGAPGILAWGFGELLVHPAGQIGYFSLAPPRFVTWARNGHELFKLYCHEIIRAATSLSGRPPIVGRAMCGTQKLYRRAAPDRNGDTWSESPGDGNLLVCDRGQLLLLHAGDLVRYSLAIGIAADEQGALLQLAPRGAVRVGNAASVLLANRIATACKADDLLQEQLVEYESLVRLLAGSSPSRLAADNETRLRSAFTALRNTCIEHPRVAKYHGIGMDWLDDQVRLHERLWNIDPLELPN